jgi:uncharacterized membrane protein
MFALHVTRSTLASRKLQILVVELIALTSVLVLRRKTKQSARQNIKKRRGLSLRRFFLYYLFMPFVGYALSGYNDPSKCPIA